MAHHLGAQIQEFRLRVASFEKKTQQTRQVEIDLARTRYKEVELYEKANQKSKR